MEGRCEREAEMMRRPAANRCCQKQYVFVTTEGGSEGGRWQKVGKERVFLSPAGLLPRSTTTRSRNSIVTASPRIEEAAVAAAATVAVKRKEK